MTKPRRLQSRGAYLIGSDSVAMARVWAASACVREVALLEVLGSMDHAAVVVAVAERELVREDDVATAPAREDLAVAHGLCDALALTIVVRIVPTLLACASCPVAHASVVLAACGVGQLVAAVFDADFMTA